MKVFVVCSGDFYERSANAVCSTRGKAERALAIGVGDDIEEMELDETDGWERGPVYTVQSLSSGAGFYRDDVSVHARHPFKVASGYTGLNCAWVRSPISFEHAEQAATECLEKLRGELVPA